MRTICFACSCFILLSSCFFTYKSPPPQKKMAWIPQYSADPSYKYVSYRDEPKNVKNAGKIYAKDNFIYQCEIGEGIHVIDNSDPAHAQRIGFIKVKGCEEISIKDNYLYTNNYYDLVTIDISKLKDVHVVSRAQNAFNASTTATLHSWEEPEDAGWFQCPQYYIDSVIVGWVQDSVYANCYKN